MICKFCGRNCLLRYRALQDYYFQTDLCSDYWECKSCQVLQSKFDGDKLAQAYSKYYTQKPIIQKDYKLQTFLFYLLNKFHRITRLPFFMNRRPFLGAPRYSFNSNSKVLDFGYGSGQKLDFFVEIFDECHGYDLYPQNINHLRQKGVIIHTNILSIPKNFDYIILDNVIEHVEDPAKIINYMLSLLRFGGTLILITPNYHSIVHKIMKNIMH